jgi:hypothetical protein
MMKKTDKPRSRLLVVVPDHELDEARYAKKARSLADYYQLDIVFLGKLSEINDESYLRRRMITLAGISTTDVISSNFIISYQKRWKSIITKEYKPGDFVLIQKDLLEIHGLFHRFNVSEEISKKFGLNTIINNEFIPANPESGIVKAILPIIYWIGIMAILVISFVVESSIGQHTFGWIRTLAEISIVGIEIFSLWIWNSIASRG